MPQRSAQGSQTGGVESTDRTGQHIEHLLGSGALGFGGDVENRQYLSNGSLIAKWDLIGRDRRWHTRQIQGSFDADKILRRSRQDRHIAPRAAVVHMRSAHELSHVRVA